VLDDGVPAEIKELIGAAIIKERQEAEQEQRKRSAHRAEIAKEWQEYNQKMKDVLPEPLRNYLVERVEEDERPDWYGCIVQVPGLAPIQVKLPGFPYDDATEVEIRSLIVGKPFEMKGGRSVDYVFAESDDRVFRSFDVGGALLCAMRMAYQYEDEVNKLEHKKQIWAEQEAEFERKKSLEPVYEATDETVDHAIMEGLRTLIREELIKAVLYAHI